MTAAPHAATPDAAAPGSRDETPLPVAAGDWVATIDGLTFEIGKVKSSYRFEGQVLIDLVLYDVAGNRVGRTSPAMGGPRTFEPAMLYTGVFRRIEPPRFPIARTMRGKPTDRAGWNQIVYDHHPSVVDKAERRTALKRSRPSNGGRRPSDYDPELERAALRRAAQEMRDLARRQSGDAAQALKARAAELETEAEKA
jgi:hypothetical protein